MPTSQNVLFRGGVPKDAESEHPAGLSLVRELSAHLQRVGYRVSRIENWRDCGWEFECALHGAELNLILSKTEADSWMLQVGPRAEDSATPVSVYDAAIVVHSFLSGRNQFAGFLWCWDEYPDESNGTEVPSSQTVRKDSFE